ncbi:MAG: LPS-assembly protein LptD [Caldimicrobium sp.]
MRKGLFYLYFILFFSMVNLSSLFALPKEKAFELTARRIEIFSDGKKILAQGDVIVEQKDLLIYAEEILYDPPTDLLELKNFKIFDFTQNATLLGNKAQLDLRNNEIRSDRIFLNFKKEGFKIKAWDFSKNALNEYRAKRALISSCDLDCEIEEFPPWSFEIRELLITPEGVSSATASTFRAKNIPLLYLPKKFYLPKISFPVFEERKRGFLFPNIAQGNRFGLALQTPYFIPLNDQIDFTFSPLFTSKRGVLLDLENQLALTGDTKASFKVRYLKDTKRSEYALTKAPKERYWISGKSDVILSPKLDLHLDIDFVSDRDFLEEFNIGEGGFDKVKNFYIERFNRDIEDKSQEYRTSKFWLQYKHNSLYTRLQSAHIDYEGKLDKKEILQPIGSFRLSLLPFQTAGVLSALTLDLDYFSRKKNYDGTRGGLNFEIAYPFNFNRIKNEFKINFKNYHYFLSKRGNFTRDNLNKYFFESSLISYTLLSRDYQWWDLYRGFQFKHSLKPYVEVFFRSKPSEKEVPIFLQEDLISDKKSAIEYGLWQFFSTKTQKNFLVIKAYQQYDLNRAYRSATATKPEERAFSDLYLQILATWREKLSLRYDTSYNFYGYGFKKHTFNLNLTDFILEKVNFLYQEDAAYNTRQATLSLSQEFFDRLILNYYISRNLKKNETSEQKLEALYFHDCYLFGFGISTTPRDTKIYFRVELKGLGGFQGPLY